MSVSPFTAALTACLPASKVSSISVLLALCAAHLCINESSTALTLEPVSALIMLERVAATPPNCAWPKLSLAPASPNASHTKTPSLFLIPSDTTAIHLLLFLAITSLTSLTNLSTSNTTSGK